MLLYYEGRFCGRALSLSVRIAGLSCTNPSQTCDSDSRRLRPKTKTRFMHVVPVSKCRTGQFDGELQRLYKQAICYAMLD